MTVRRGQAVVHALEDLHYLVNSGEIEPNFTIATEWLCDKCKMTDRKAMIALESLTPGGSEFVGDVERCLGHIRAKLNRQHESIKRLIKKRKEKGEGV